MTHIPLGQSFAGGLLIGSGVALLLLFDGAIAGISGIFDHLIHGNVGEQGWRLAFLVGLLLPAVALGTGRIDWAARASMLALAGFLVGLGTRLGSGCTSGHGVCGIARFSPRSLAATITFIALAMVTVWIARWIQA